MYRSAGFGYPKRTSSLSFLPPLPCINYFSINHSRGYNCSWTYTKEMKPTRRGLLRQCAAQTNTRYLFSSYSSHRPSTRRHHLCRQGVVLTTRIYVHPQGSAFTRIGIIWRWYASVFNGFRYLWVCYTIFDNHWKHGIEIIIPTRYFQGLSLFDELCLLMSTAPPL